MYALFDSGSGGLNTVRYIKDHCPECDLIYLIDRENAPYGIKNEKELIRIVKNNIGRLLSMRAEGVLIACCTASTVYSRLPRDLQKTSIPIIKPIAQSARNSTRTGSVGIIATEGTVRSHAFKRELSDCRTYEIAAGELVTMIDGGLSDNNITDTRIKEISRMLCPFEGKDIDTLILGCTHFPSLKLTVADIVKEYGIKAVINSAEEGAKALMAHIKAGP